MQHTFAQSSSQAVIKAMLAAILVTADLELSNSQTKFFIQPERIMEKIPPVVVVTKLSNNLTKKRLL
jgi:hypothetical protein